MRWPCEDYQQVLSNLSRLPIASGKEKPDSEDKNRTIPQETESDDDESEVDDFKKAEQRQKIQQEQEALRAKRKIEDLKPRYPYGLIPAKELAPKRGAGYVSSCYMDSIFFNSGDAGEQISAAVGGTIRDPNPCSESIAGEIKPGFKVLDIGCSYGVQIFPLLHKGAEVVANDSDAFSLQALANSLKPEDHKKVQISYGKFPEETDFPADYFDAVTMYYIIHYMKPEEIRSSFKKIYEILKPNGKIYITTLTPYCGNFEWYTERALLNQKAGHEWPGEIVDRARIWEEITGQPKEKLDDSNLPNYMHPQFLEILLRETITAGFRGISGLGYCCLDEEAKDELKELRTKKNIPLRLLNSYEKCVAYMIAEKK